MLAQSVVLNSVLGALQSIPQLAAELGAPDIPATESITAHYSYMGEENSFNRVLQQMRSPSIIVAYLDYTMGNFDAMTMWKHRLNICIRSRNKASNGSAISAQELWAMAMNLPVSMPYVAPNIRYVDLANGLLWLRETNLKFQTDELGQDFHVGTMVWDELGDSQLDGSEFLNIGPSSGRLVQLAPTVDGFALAIRRHLSAGERQQLLAGMEEEQGVSNGDTHTE
jgi:hypothetical protein